MANEPEQWESEGENFKKIIERVEEEAKKVIRESVDITKYRWDMPDISLSWKGEDGIERNVHVFILGIHGDYTLVIEHSAWMDDKVELQRKWRPGSGKSVELHGVNFSETVMKEFVEKLEHAYSEVCQAREKDLIFTSDLKPKQ